MRFSRSLILFEQGKDMNTVVERARSLAEPICEELGLELFDVAYAKRGKSWVLTVLVDKAGGVAVDDLRNVSLQLGALLDIEDFVPQKYTLEVSSPGIMRPLRCPADFARFCGQKARVVLNESIGSTRRFEGRIEGVVVSGDHAVISFGLSSGQRLDVPFEHICRANLFYTTRELLAGVGRK